MTPILERLAAAKQAALDDYATPKGSAQVIAARFQIGFETAKVFVERAMWTWIISERERKRRIKLGLDEEKTPSAVSLEPSRRMIAEGLRFARCPAADMPKAAETMRQAAWANGWSVTATRWVGMVPHRKAKGDPWGWTREKRVALWLERDGVRACAHWTNGGWASGQLWSPGQFRAMIGNRALLAAVKTESGSL